MNKKNTKKTVGSLAVEEQPAIVENPKPDPTHVEALLANAAEVNGVRYCVLPVNMLEVEGAYQRPTQNEVRNIVAKWDSTRLGVVSVNLRNGRFYIVDGQNRVEAAKLKGVGNLMCTVTIGETVGSEAHRFVTQDDGKKALSSYDKFYAQCVDDQDGELARGIKALLDKYHVIYANSNVGKKDERGNIIPRAPGMETPGKIGGMTTVMCIGRVNGLDMVDNIFQLIQRLGWHTMPNAYSRTILSAMRNAFVGREAERVKDALYRAIHNETPKSLINHACSENDKLGPTAATTALLCSFVS